MFFKLIPNIVTLMFYQNPIRMFRSEMQCRVAGKYEIAVHFYLYFGSICQYSDLKRSSATRGHQFSRVPWIHRFGLTIVQCNRLPDSETLVRLQLHLTWLLMSWTCTCSSQLLFGDQGYHPKNSRSAFVNTIFQCRQQHCSIFWLHII